MTRTEALEVARVVMQSIDEANGHNTGRSPDEEMLFDMVRALAEAVEALAGQP